MRISSFSRSAALLAVLASLALAGCAPAMNGHAYYRGETMRPQTVELGVVESARAVLIEPPDTGAGTVGGAVVGGALGNMAGGGGRGAAAPHAAAHPRGAG